MIENDISRLNAQEHFDLDGLEADIWRQECRVLARRAATRRVASYQALVLLLAVAGSGVAGAAMAAQFAPPSTFVAEENLAPSHLLLGTH
jgi:hypothetical protein